MLKELEIVAILMILTAITFLMNFHKMKVSLIKKEDESESLQQYVDEIGM